MSTEPVQLSDRMILDFERPIIDLEKKISELRGLSTETVDFSSEIRRLESKSRKLQKEIFADLNAQQKVQLARHPGRPYLMDYVGLMMDEFVELHGDRSFRDDPAMGGGALLDVGGYQAHAWVAMTGRAPGFVLDGVERNLASSGIDGTTHVAGRIGGTRVDARSHSRVGTGDLGVNGGRLLAYFSALRGALAAEGLKVVDA
jgi:hypothetical protein